MAGSWNRHAFDCLPGMGYFGGVIILRAWRPLGSLAPSDKLGQVTDDGQHDSTDHDGNPGQPAMSPTISVVRLAMLGITGIWAARVGLDRLGVS